MGAKQAKAGIGGMLIHKSRYTTKLIPSPIWRTGKWQLSQPDESAQNS